MTIHENLGSLLASAFEIAADDTMTALLAKAEDALATPVDADPPVSDLFDQQPNYARDMPREAPGTIASLAALDVVERWTDGDDDDRRDVDAQLERQRRDIERQAHEWTFGR